MPNIKKEIGRIKSEALNDLPGTLLFKAPRAATGEQKAQRTEQHRQGRSHTFHTVVNFKMNKHKSSYEIEYHNKRRPPDLVSYQNEDSANQLSIHRHDRVKCGCKETVPFEKRREFHHPIPVKSIVDHAINEARSYENSKEEQTKARPAFEENMETTKHGVSACF